MCLLEFCGSSFRYLAPPICSVSIYGEMQGQERARLPLSAPQHGVGMKNLEKNMGLVPPGTRPPTSWRQSAGATITRSFFLMRRMFLSGSRNSLSIFAASNGSAFRHFKAMNCLPGAKNLNLEVLFQVIKWLTGNAI